jgi:hypothetical protein
MILDLDNPKSRFQDFRGSDMFRQHLWTENGSDVQIQQVIENRTYFFKVV